MSKIWKMSRSPWRRSLGRSKLESGNSVEEDHDSQSPEIRGKALLLLPREEARPVAQLPSLASRLSPDFIQVTVERTMIGPSQEDSISSWF